MPLDLNTVLGQQSPANPSAGAQAPATPPESPDQPGQPAPEEGNGDFKSVDPAATLETLPPDVLDIPVIYDVAKGNPPAVSAPDKAEDPAVQTITKNAQALVAAGFGLYESIDGKNWVLFNASKMSPGDLHEADAAGKLDQIAPPFTSVKSATPGAPAQPAGMPGAAPQAPAQQPESQPAPSVQAKLATSRAANLAPGAPTSGPAPGAGRLLNNILKPAV